LFCCKAESHIRESYWDQLKGLCIIAVLGIHALESAATAQHACFDYQFALVVRQIINFAVPIFLALAGYMAGRKTTGPMIIYYKSRFVRLLPPYLFWTCVYMLLRHDGFDSLPKIILGFVAGTGIGVGYFVIVLAQMVVLTPFLAKIRSLRVHIWLMLLLTCVGGLYSYGLRIGMPDLTLSKFPAYALAFFVWYPFYHIGFLAGRERWEKSKFLIKYKSVFVALWVLFIPIAVAEGVLLSSLGFDSLAMSQNKISSYTGSIFLFLAALALFHRWHGASFKPLVWLGENSYFIYLVHLLAFQFLKKVYVVPSGVSAFFILLVGGMSLCFLAGTVGRRVLPSKLHNFIMG
jgi:fucose 4-O-acetylase-like acetyltransferase